MFDPGGARSKTDGGGSAADGHVDRSLKPDGPQKPDGGEEDGPVQTCTDGEVICRPTGEALYCKDGAWVSLGPCFLGCVESPGACRIPSNIATSQIEVAESDVSDWVLPADKTITVDTESGEIVNTTDDVQIRPPGEGVLAEVGFEVHAQPQTNAPDLGVFIVHDAHIPPATIVALRGPGASFVLLATGEVRLEGVIDGGAWGREPGPGGFWGGNIDEAGGGPCPGQAGNPLAGCVHLCGAGSGGGGYGGAGGAGADLDCNELPQREHAAAPGGAGGDGDCGTADLIPLHGGSGGAGGITLDSDDTDPGIGGGGGGGVQISARGGISIGAGGGIRVPGQGGGQSEQAAGAGGGAGGAVLLEATDFSFQPGAFMTANGGGGGAGGCS